MRVTGGGCVVCGGRAGGQHNFGGGNGGQSLKRGRQAVRRQPSAPHTLLMYDFLPQPLDSERLTLFSRDEQNLANCVCVASTMTYDKPIHYFSTP